MINVLLSPRFKSFYWRLVMMIVATVISFILANLDVFQLSVGMTATLGLILGEISKALNNYLQGEPLGFAR